MACLSGVVRVEAEDKLSLTAHPPRHIAPIGHLLLRPGLAVSLLLHLPLAVFWRSA